MPADLQSAPFGRLGTDPFAPLGARILAARRSATLAAMPSFDVVSEVDRQEVRNAVDQARREINTRFDFKNTSSEIDQTELTFTLRTVSEDRLTALRQVFEEKLVKRGVSLKGLDYGKVEEATQNTVRQVATLQGRHLQRQGTRDQQARQGEGAQGRVQPDPGRRCAGPGQEARRPPGGDRRAQGCRPRHPGAVPELPRLNLRPTGDDVSDVTLPCATGLSCADDRGDRGDRAVLLANRGN